MGAAEPLLGVVGKEQEPDVAWGVVPVDAGGDLHSAVDFPRIWLINQAAADIGQKLPDLGLTNLLDRHTEGAAVVKGDSCCKLNELCEDRPLGLDGFIADPREIFSPCLLQSFRCLMVAGVAAWSLDDENVLSLDDFRREDGLIDRVQSVAAAPDPRLGLGDLSRA